LPGLPPRGGAPRMATAMNKGESFREYFRRAGHDPAVRAHLLENARYSRSFFGWITFVFAVLAFGMTVYDLLHDGVWMSRASILCTFGFTINWLIYDKFGDRVAMYASMDELASPSLDRPPMPATPPASREPPRR
jgi:hypothetical protein